MHDVSTWCMMECDAMYKLECSATKSLLDTFYIFQWIEVDSTCQRTVGICEFQFGSQDNWLITQFINNTIRQAELYLILE